QGSQVLTAPSPGTPGEGGGGGGLASRLGPPVRTPAAPRCLPSIFTTARTGPDCSTFTYPISLVNVISRPRRTCASDWSSVIKTSRPACATTRPASPPIVIDSMSEDPLRGILMVVEPLRTSI